jgi:hypothetical protein
MKVWAYIQRRRAFRGLMWPPTICPRCQLTWLRKDGTCKGKEMFHR